MRFKNILTCLYATINGICGSTICSNIFENNQVCKIVGQTLLFATTIIIPKQYKLPFTISIVSTTLSIISYNKYKCFVNNKIKVLPPNIVLKDKIGVGAYSTIYTIDDISLNDNFVIKKVDKSIFYDKYKTLVNEYNILIQLDNPNIIKCYGLYEDINAIYLMLDRLENITLNFIIWNIKNSKQWYNIMLQIATAIEHCHENNIVHNDIKPTNIIIKGKNLETCRIILIDFGSATKISAGSDMLYSNNCMYSPRYADPDIINKQMYNGKKADIWSFGQIMLEIHGKVGSFDNIYNIDIIDSSSIIKHCLDQNPNFRPSAQMLRSALNEANIANNISYNF